MGQGRASQQGHHGFRIVAVAMTPATHQIGGIIVLDRCNPDFDSSPCYNCDTPSMSCEVCCGKLARWDKDHPKHQMAVEDAERWAKAEAAGLSDQWRKAGKWQNERSAVCREHEYLNAKRYYAAHKEEILERRKTKRRRKNESNKIC